MSHGADGWHHWWWLRGTADGGVRARTDVWPRLVGHGVDHVSSGVEMTTMQRRPATWLTAIPDVSIRCSTADDWPEVATFLDRYTEDSRHSNLSPDDPTPSVEIPSGCDAKGGTLVAEWAGSLGGRPVIVGLVSWLPLGRPRARRAGIVLVLASGWGARGVGSALVAVAAREARRGGIEGFVLPVIPRNGMLRAAANAAGLSERRRTTRTRDEVEIFLRANGA